jgi:hypothetical protein
MKVPMPLADLRIRNNAVSNTLFVPVTYGYDGHTACQDLIPNFYPLHKFDNIVQFDLQSWETCWARHLKWISELSTLLWLSV